MLDVDEEFTSPINAWSSVALRLREVIRRTLVSAVIKGKVCKDKAKSYLEAGKESKDISTISFESI